MTNCKATYKFICENLDENLNSPTCLKIKQHLDDCPNCRKYLNSLMITVQLYKRQSTPKLKKTISKKIINLVKAEKSSKIAKKTKDCS